MGVYAMAVDGVDDGDADLVATAAGLTVGVAYDNRCDGADVETTSVGASVSGTREMTTGVTVGIIGAENGALVRIKDGDAVSGCSTGAAVMVWTGVRKTGANVLLLMGGRTGDCVLSTAVGITGASEVLKGRAATGDSVMLTEGRPGAVTTEGSGL